METRLIVVHTGTGFALECRTPAGATMTFDNPPEGTSGGSPMEHLLAAFGACALMDVGLILTKKRLTWSNLRVECVGARPEGVTPRPFTDLKLLFRVDGDVPTKAFDDAVRIAVEKQCSVGATLARATPAAWEAKVGP